MDFVTSASAHVCGQGRCFLVDGVALPVCQRCMGLYLGAAMTGVWLFSSRVGGRGLPSNRVFLIHAVVLLAAMLGGIHVIDFGATWRLLCGLWAGHIFVLWLVGGAHYLWHTSLPVASTGLGCSRRDEFHSVLAIAVLVALAFVIPEWHLLGWHVWTTLITAGALILVSAVAGAAAAIAAWSGRATRRRCVARPTQEVPLAESRR